MNDEHLVVPERSAQQNKQTKKQKKNGSRPKKYKSQTERAPKDHHYNNLNMKINNMVFHYNSKY